MTAIFIVESPRCPSGRSLEVAKGIERAVAGCGVIDNALGIDLGRQLSAKPSTADGWSRPAGGELGHPAAHIVARGIEFLALQHGIEDAEIGRGVGAAAGDPLPASALLARSASTSVSQNQRSPIAPVDAAGS